MADRLLLDVAAVGKLGSEGAADGYPYLTTHPYPAHEWRLAGDGRTPGHSRPEK